ncbi:MAG: prephenate dehydrogenase/arogenate dehydrogenase family protein [Endomicrobium sp.]|jgi:prephenate dehydrogenase|nr:prephenate dehydrogenase/arogenate dehydrogenase family protein [Endomicrobium sp.]
MYKVSIIGMGQMGGSLGKALKKVGNKYYIIGVDKDKTVLKAALQIGAADEVSQNLKAIKESWIAVICLPVNLIAPVYKRILKIVGKETVITDTGSVKGNIVSAADKNNFVPAHPMAGREKNGIISACAEMFRNANLIITENKNPAAEKKVIQMWKDAGAKIVKMSVKKHDNLAALTSHLPHIIAFSLNKIYKKSKKNNPEIDMLTAGSFKSMTRVSISSTDMWAPIFAMNAENVGRHLSDFIKELETFKKALNSQNKLKKEILKTQK